MKAQRYAKELVTVQGRKFFAGVRGRVVNAVAAQPQSVTLEAARKQMARFHGASKTS